MSKEIIEALRTIEREKGIEAEVLISALEDALLAAYKKTPGASRHATVELDEESGDFRVFSIELPADLEEGLLDEARERAIEELERAELETGERQHTLLSDDDLQIDWDEIPADQIEREDVTPDGFGRIAAQTAKQVIQQRIREAERQIMYEEYIDRVSEVVTGIVQQAGEYATTSSSTSARSRRCCRAPSRWTASATSRAAASRRSSPRCARARRARR